MKFVKKFLKKNKKLVKNVVKVLVVAKAVIEVLDVLMKLWEWVSPFLNQLIDSLGSVILFPLCRDLGSPAQATQG